MDVLNYFTLQEWKFTNDRVQGIIDKLDKKDKELFQMDMREVIWDTYFQTYIKGVRVYLIKDPLDTLPQARIRWQRYNFLN